jgi:hypothetical protein
MNARRAAPPSEHPVTPPAPAAAWTLAAAAVVPALVLGYFLLQAPGAATPGTAFAACVLVGATALLAWAFRRRRVVFDGEVLAVTSALFRRRVARDAIDLDRARVVDLAEHTGLRPRWKAFGMGLPGYRAGWYFLAGRARGFCLVTDTRRVLWLPLRDGGALLLSLERPQALLDALRGPAG